MMAEFAPESRTSPDRTTRRWRMLVAIGIAAATFLTFAGTMKMDFLLWDDDVNVYANPRIRGLTAENVRWMFQDVDQALRYKPLSWLTWAVIWEMNGPAPFGYHVANVVLHSFNAALVFLVLSALVPAARQDRSILPSVKSDGRRALLACALGALVWALHPLRVEPVAWVTGLPYGQALFFMLLSLICYLHTTQNANSRKRQTFYVLSVVLFGLALLTYPIVIGFIGVLMVLDWYQLRQFGTDGFKLSTPAVRRAIVEKIPFAVAGIVFVAINLYGRLHSVEKWDFAPPTLDEFGVLHRIMQGFYVWANYLWRQWWPFELAPFYTRLIDFRPTDPAFVASMVVVVVVTGFTYFQRRARPVLLALWVSYLALLVPALGLTDHPHFAVDRYGIAAGICWSVLITVGLVYIKQNRAMRVATVSAAVGLVIGLHSLTLRQMPIWQDTVTLCEDMLKKLNEPRFRVAFHNRLAVFYLKKGDLERAQSELAQLGENRPTFAASTYSILASSLAEANREGEAVEAYVTSLRLRPGNPSVRYELALLLAKSQRLAEADHHYRELLRLANGTMSPRFEARLLEAMAAGYAAIGRMEDACSRAEKAIRLAESDKQFTNLVQLTANLEQYRQARRPEPGPQ